MKRTLYSLISIAMLSACTEKVPFEYPECEDVLLLNAQIDASMTEHYAYVGISRTTTVAKLDTATVACYVNGRLVSYGELCDDEDGPTSCFKFHTELAPGDSLRLTATYGETVAYADVAVPASDGRIDAVDTLSATDGSVLKTSITDLETSDSYYRLRLELQYWMDVYQSGEDIPVRHYGTSDITMSGHDDVILSDGKLGEDDEDNFFGNYTTNSLNIFTDRYFRGKSCTVETMADLQGWALMNFDEDFDRICLVRSAIMHLQTLTEEEYDYLSAQNVLIDNDWDSSDLLQLVSLPNNVTGGIGFVSAFQSTSGEAIRLPDLEFSLTQD